MTTEPLLQKTLQKLFDEVHAQRQTLGHMQREMSRQADDLRQVRQVVGISLPPPGEKNPAMRLALWHLQGALRHGVSVGIGAAIAWLFSQLGG